VARMLLQLHTNTDFGQDDKIILFEDQFIGSCFRIIEKQRDKIISRSEE